MKKEAFISSLNARLRAEGIVYVMRTGILPRGRIGEYVQIVFTVGDEQRFCSFMIEENMPIKVIKHISETIKQSIRYTLENKSREVNKS